MLIIINLDLHIIIQKKIKKEENDFYFNLMVMVSEKMKSRRSC